MVLSNDPEAICSPLREYARLVTLLVCPSRVNKHWPVFESQILTVLSSDPVAILYPLG